MRQHRRGTTKVWIEHFFSLALVLPALILLSSGGAEGLGDHNDYNEAPQLAARVAAGELPPVAERLPENPLVVEPYERIGNYGGTWRSAVVGGAYRPSTRQFANDNLVRWTPDWDGVIPNIAESWEVNEEATAYTFYLREGMKWSDGHPFTADDIMFWYEDVLMNEELTPTVPGWLTSEDEPVVVEKVDDYTVIFRFASPNGMFLFDLARDNVNDLTQYPRHYLSQFHIAHNPDNIAALVREAGVEGWANLFHLKEDHRDNSDHPTLHAWVLTTAFGESTTRFVAERNPYYWKVDPEGNQLPYIDRITWDVIADADVLLLRVLNGDIDMLDLFFATPENKPVVMDTMDRGNYHLYSLIPTYPNALTIQLNLNHPDPVKREVFNNKDFRIGLSYAIDRQEIIDLVFVGQGEPYQVAPRPESELYNERLARQYTEYDVDLANDYLDRAGYSQRDAQGYRLGPDGNRISFLIELDAGRLTYVDTMELVREHWQAVGIDAQVRTMDRALWEVRVRDNAEFDVTAHAFGGGIGLSILLDPRYFFPYNSNSLFARGWQQWYRNPNHEDAEEPPAEVKRQVELFSQLRTTADFDRQTEFMREILDIAAEQFYVLGITLEEEGYGIVKNNMRNVPGAMPNHSIYANPAPTNPQQYFFENP